MIRLGKKAYVIPKEYLDIKEYTDYSALTLAEMKRLTGKGTDLARPEEQITIQDTKTAIEEQEEEIFVLNQQKEKLEQQQREELEKSKGKSRKNTGREKKPLIK